MAKTKLDIARLSFLIVGENTLERNAIRDVLHSMGARNTRLFRNAGKALAELQAVPADIVIFDWEMAVLSGKEFAFQVRSNLQGIARFAVLIAVCGELSKELVFEAMKMGVHDFIGKPITIGSLTSRLHQNLKATKDFISMGPYFGPCHSHMEKWIEGKPGVNKISHPLAAKFANAVVKQEQSAV